MKKKLQVVLVGLQDAEATSWEWAVRELMREAPPAAVFDTAVAAEAPPVLTLVPPAPEPEVRVSDWLGDPAPANVDEFRSLVERLEAAVGRLERRPATQDAPPVQVGTRGVVVLTDHQVQQLRKEYETGQWSLRALGRKYGVHGSTVFRIVKRIRRADVT